MRRLLLVAALLAPLLCASCANTLSVTTEVRSQIVSGPIEAGNSFTGPDWGSKVFVSVTAPDEASKANLSAEMDPYMTQLHFVRAKNKKNADYSLLIEVTSDKSRMEAEERPVPVCFPDPMPFRRPVPPGFYGGSWHRGVFMDPFGDYHRYPGYTCFTRFEIEYRQYFRHSLKVRLVKGKTALYEAVYASEVPCPRVSGLFEKLLSTAVGDFWSQSGSVTREISADGMSCR